MRAPMSGFAARVAVSLALLALAAALPGTALAGRQHASQLSRKDVDDLNRVSNYLNGLPPLKGRFLQTSEEPGKRPLQATGTFYLKQPGRLRFEYDPPQKVLFISDGRMVTVEDKELESVNNYPLSRTPLHLLLKGNLDLKRDARIVAVRRTPGWLQVTVRKDGGGEMSGQLTMTFSYPRLELHQWSVVDSKQTRTTVALRKVQKGVKLRPGLFRATDYDFENWD